MPYIILTVIGLIFLFMTTNHISVLKNFLPLVEGFSPVPIWDNKQWSWGYGTAAGYDHSVKPKGTITREQAMNELIKVVDANYAILKPLIKRSLNGNQIAALLSFAYNLGPGNAKNLIPNINNGNDTALFSQWMKYINSNGVPNIGLENRRQKEIALYKS